MAQRLMGGVGETMEATPEIQEICDKMKPHAEQQTNQKFAEFKACTYSTQVVAGTNYFIKVHVGDDKHIHLRVYETLPHAGSELLLTAVQQDNSRCDPVLYFAD